MTLKREERVENPQVALLSVMAGLQSSIWTALPGIIEGVDLAKMTARVKPAMQARITQQTGEQTWVTLPLLVDCPIIFPSGGGFTLTFPVAAGDECLVIFASRCIDGWWQSGGQAQPPELRMHDLSDGFVLVGPRSQPNVMSPAPSSGGAELRNAARSSFVRLDASGHAFVQAEGNVTLVAAGQASVQAPTIQLIGNVTINGNLTVNGNTSLIGTAQANGKNIGSTHTHSGVQTGSGSTGAPN